jgi:endonuclease III
MKKPTSRPRRPRRPRTTLAERAARIGEQLEELFPRPAIPLDHEDPFTLLVSVVLSAQCSDARVNQTAPLLYARASRPEDMARLSPREIERIIRPCGLAPAKSKNIHRLSQLLVERHGGEVPRTFEELEALPGVGHKTASVVMAQAFGVPAFPVDTHIHRLAGRWRLSRARNVAEVERDLKRLYPPESWADRHLQIIYFGRAYCPARAHVPENCPICSWAS